MTTTTNKSDEEITFAVKNQDLATFEKKITENLDSNGKLCPVFGNSLLHIAICSLEHTKLTDIKFAKGLAIIKQLLEYKSDVNLSNIIPYKNRPNEYKCTPLIVATKNNNPSIIKLLLEFNADENIQDSDGNIPLHFITSDTMDLFKMTKENIYVENSSGDTPFFSALFENEYAVAEKMIEFGVDINHQTKKYGRSVLFQAISSDDFELYKYLSAKNINKMALDNKGQTILFSALNSDFLKQILEENAVDINHQNKFGNTVLHEAAESDYRDYVIDMLIDNGADMNIKNNINAYPLTLAVYNSSLKSTEALLDRISYCSLKKQLNIIEHQ